MFRGVSCLCLGLIQTAVAVVPVGVFLAPFGRLGSGRGLVQTAVVVDVRWGWNVASAWRLLVRSWGSLRPGPEKETL